MTKKLTHKEFIERFNKTETSKYFDIIWEYIDGRKPIKVKCKTCGKEYFYNQAVQLIVYTRKWCPDCSKKNQIRNDLSIEEVNKKIEQRWYVCIEYTDSHTYANCVCMWCWRKYKKIINNLSSFRPGKYKYCLFCQWNASHWEQMLATILDNLWIEYIYNQTLPINNTLRYDFILEKEKLIIEIDWSFHRDTRFDWNNYFWKNQKMVKERDNEKDINAINSWYSVVRINYNNNKLWQFFIDIVEKLNDYININDVKLSLIDLFCLHK